MFVQGNRIKALVLLTTMAVSASALAVETPAPAEDLRGVEVVAGCTEADFVDVEAGAVAEIGFGGPRGYTPRCLRVQAGTQVTIQASKRHPLQAMDPVGGVANPFFNSAGGSQTSVTQKLDQPGVFGFFCTNHGDVSGEGMAGAILVFAPNAH